MPGSPPLLVLSDGDVPGLLALRAAADRGEGPVLVWPVVGGGPEAAARARAVRQQAEVVGARLFGPGDGADHGEVPLSALLVGAAAAGAEAGCSAAVWPVSAGEKNTGAEALARISAAVERAACITRLVGIDHPGFELMAPYADLSDRQLADLVLDMDLPIWTCWWYAAEARDPASVLAEGQRERWAAMLASAGWRGPLPGPGVKAAAKAV